MRSGLTLATLALLAATGAANAASLLVVNQGSATVSVVDTASLAVTGRIDEHQSGGMHVHEVAVSPDGATAYLPVYGDSGVGRPGVDGRELLITDIATRRVTGTVDFGRGVRPHLPVVDPRSGLVYVTTEVADSVTIVDPARRAIVGSIPTGAAQSHMLVLSHDGRLGYTANVGPGSVSVLDIPGRRTLAVIPVAASVQRIAITADDRLVFTADTQQPRLAVIDTATREVRQWIALPGIGYGASATPDGRWLLVAVPALDRIAVIDLATMAVVRTVAVGKSPQAVVTAPDSRVAYVSCSGDGVVTAVDLTRWTALRTIPTASGADGMALAGR